MTNSGMSKAKLWPRPISSLHFFYFTVLHAPALKGYSAASWVWNPFSRHRDPVEAKRSLITSPTRKKEPHRVARSPAVMVVKGQVQLPSIHKIPSYCGSQPRPVTLLYNVKAVLEGRPSTEVCNLRFGHVSRLVAPGLKLAAVPRFRAETNGLKRPVPSQAHLKVFLEPYHMKKGRAGGQLSWSGKSPSCPDFPFEVHLFVDRAEASYLSVVLSYGCGMLDNG
jgi:hypothetical protein